MPRAIIETVQFPTDQRGFVIEPLDAPRLGTQQNVHLAVTEPGAVRGNHYHSHCTEVATVLGPALVRLREDGAIRDVEVPEGHALRFTLPPGVSHAFQNTGTKPTILIAFSTAVFDREHPDVIRDMLIDR